MKRTGDRTDVDWGGDARKKSSSNIREVPDWAMEYGGEYTIKNGAVTNVRIFYHP